MSRTPVTDVAPPDLPGYQYIKHIGSGGNAQVYLYEQELPRRKVAVKVLNESALSEAARRRFTAEANVTAGLAHRHIVQVFDANVTADGRPYLVMPYYPQPNMSVRARRSHFSIADVLRIGIQLGSAVETSHRHDVLHRDIKPQNILTDSYGEPALTDFGIATTTGGDGPEGLSVPWSPPEILYGTGPGDQRADVYSLGATLWHLLVGRSPFELPGGDNSTFSLMGRIQSDPPPRTQRADTPDSLERLLRQSMAKDPEARPQSAMELIRGLQSIEQELRLPLTHPILPADEPSGDTSRGDTVTRMRARGSESTSGWGGAAGAGQPAPRDSTQAAWGPDGGYADPRTHGGRGLGGPLPGDSPTGGPLPGGQAQPGSAPGGPVTGGTFPGGYPQGGPGQPGAPYGGTFHAAPGQAGPYYPGQAPPGPGQPGQAPWGHTVNPSSWQSGPGQRRDDARSAWDSGAQGTWSGQAAAGLAGAPAMEDDATRTRGPVRIDPRGVDPRGVTPEAEDDATRTRGPVRLDPYGTGRRAADDATRARGQVRLPATAGDPAGGGARGARHGAEPRVSARVMAIAGSGVAVVVAAVVALLTLTGGHGQACPAPSGSGSAPAASSGGQQNALGPGATAPGQPTATVHRVDADEVRFTWTYANPVAGDTFRWERVSGTAGQSGGVLSKPELTVPLPTGMSLCVIVQARRPSGQASEASQPVCTSS